MGSMFSFPIPPAWTETDIGGGEYNPSSYEHAAELIGRNFGRVMVITGAGISSHILPTFRSSDSNALWDVLPKPSLDKTYFYSDPFIAWKLASNVRNLQIRNELHTSIAHRAIHYMIKEGYVGKVVTQNVDSLHSFSGDEGKIIEIHGKVTDFGECEKCRTRRTVDHTEVLRTGLCPKCNVCGSVLRPSVAFFHDMIPQHIRQSVYEHISKINVLILVGTHCAVDPVLSYVCCAKKMGAVIIEINPEMTCVSSIANMKFSEKADDALANILKLLIPNVDLNVSVPGEL